MTIQSMMREVLRMVGDPDGSTVSKEFILQAINNESKIVCAKFPNKVHLEYTTTSAASSFPVADFFGAGEPVFSIKDVLVDGVQWEVVGSDEIKRAVQA